MRRFIILLLLPSAFFAEENSLDLAFQYYKQGKFSQSLKISEKFLRKSPDAKNSEKLLYIYITSETSLYRIDRKLDLFYKDKKKSRFFYLSVYRAMERALVLGNYSIGKKWGKIFSAEAEQFDFYGKGLYLYSCILYDAGSTKELKSLLPDFTSKDIDSYSIKRMKQLSKKL